MINRRKLEDQAKVALCGTRGRCLIVECESWVEGFGEPIRFHSSPDPFSRNYQQLPYCFIQIVIE